MRRILALLMVSLLCLPPVGGFAEDNPPSSTTNVHSTLEEFTMTETIWYNAFGVAVGGKSKNHSKVKTVREVDEDNNGTVDKTYTYNSTNDSETTLEWIGGSLKAKATTGTAESDGTDGSNSTTTFNTNYEYDASGRLSDATGGSHTEGDKGLDANGEEIGEFTSSTTNEYSVKNGQLLLDKSVSTSTTWQVGKSQKAGNEKDTSRTVTKNDYTLLGGDWVVTKTTEKTRTKHLTGALIGKHDLSYKITTFQRDNTGKITGMSVSMPLFIRKSNGEYRRVNFKWVENGNDGAVKMYLTGYKPGDAKFDSKMGWYIPSETTTYNQNPPPSPYEPDNPTPEDAEIDWVDSVGDVEA